jgi:isopenicillin-N N-acyltransferase-like protein
MTNIFAPNRPTVAIDGDSPLERGHQRASQLGESLHTGIELYNSLFSLVGIPADKVRSDGDRLLDVVASWAPELAEEMVGVAEGAGVEPWQIVALNGRTEILSQARGARPGECSTVAHQSSTTFGTQTWDWHEEMGQQWHMQTVSGNARSFVGITEHGILSKIGMNDAGLSVNINILGHVEDGPTGVPIHLLIGKILGSAASVAEALELIAQARICSSSVLTLMDGTRAVMAELSPAGIAVHEPNNGMLAHTNHFLDAGLSQGEKPGLYDPDSQDRLALIESRLERYPAPTGPDDILQFLYSDPGQAAICCVPDPEGVFGTRWATLATVTMENDTRTMRVAEGSPIDARGGNWLAVLQA